MTKYQERIERAFGEGVVAVIDEANCTAYVEERCLEAEVGAPLADMKRAELWMGDNGYHPADPAGNDPFLLDFPDCPDGMIYVRYPFSPWYAVEECE